MKITMPDDSDVFADFMQRVGDNGYMIGINPVVGEKPPLDIECAGMDPATGGITGYRVDEDGDRAGALEIFHGVEHIEVY